MVTYYFIPLALLQSNHGLFFLILNLVMISLLFGLVGLISIFLPTFQNGVLTFLLCLCRKDRAIGPIIRNRLESGRDRNMKIALMVTVSVCFIFYQSSGVKTIVSYFKDVWFWYMTGDILMTYHFSLGNLNEVPMADYLETTWMQGDNPAVTSYMFKSSKLSDVVGGAYMTRLEDLSSFNYFNVDIYATSENYL